MQGSFVSVAVLSITTSITRKKGQLVIMNGSSILLLWDRQHISVLDTSRWVSAIFGCSRSIETQEYCSTTYYGVQNGVSHTYTQELATFVCMKEWVFRQPTQWSLTLMPGFQALYPITQFIENTAQLPSQDPPPMYPLTLCL